MLPRKKRVNKTIFKDIFKNSRSYHSPYFTLRCSNIISSSDVSEKDSQFSFVVSKKVANKSPERNLLKRRGYSAVKSLEKDLKTGFICIFFLKKEVKSMKFSDFKEEIRVLLKKAHVLK